MARIRAVHTLPAVALMLGVSEDVLYELTIEMGPEDGCISVYGPGDEYTPAFTADGIDQLRELIVEYSRAEFQPKTDPPRS